MKYIRTKSGYIFDKENLDMTFHGSQEEYNFWKQYLRAEHLNQHYFLADKILKEANTIEELCDEFIEVGNGKPFLSEVRFKHWDKQTKNILNKQGTEVYGAIWILDYNGSPTLKSVAKMNKKGELELL